MKDTIGTIKWSTTFYPSSPNCRAKYPYLDLGPVARTLGDRARQLEEKVRRVERDRDDVRKRLRF